LAFLLAAVPAVAKSDVVQLRNPGPQYSFDGHEVALAITVEEPAPVALVYSAEGLPEGLQIDPATGVITGTVEAPGSLCTQVTVLVEAGGQKAESRFDWVVESKGVLSCGGQPHSGVSGLPWVMVWMVLALAVLSRRPRNHALSG
jgi:hypothetical protein